MVGWCAKRFISWNLCLLYSFYLLSREVCGFVWSKWCMLNEIEINKYSLPSLMGNPDLGATVSDFIAILQSIDYSKKLKENAGQRTQLICRKLKLLIAKNFESHFKVNLGTRTIKPSWWNSFSKNEEWYCRKS